MDDMWSGWEERAEARTAKDHGGAHDWIRGALGMLGGLVALGIIAIGGLVSLLVLDLQLSAVAYAGWRSWEGGYLGEVLAAVVIGWALSRVL